jgi:glucosamine kinase
VAYYLGIDGGGSKTTCVVGDEASQLAMATAGGSNITRVGEVRARESLHQAIRDACAAAKIDPRQIQRGCVGVAGAGRDEVAAIVRKVVAELIPAEIDVVGDMPIALEAAFGAGPGVIVIAGTGSIAYGRNARGETARAGGWGYAISDEGSAHWIGREAVAALLRAIDQQIGCNDEAADVAARLPLFRELQIAWKIHSLDELVPVANSCGEFETLFPSVVAAAAAGDSTAESVLNQAGEQLAQLARIAAQRIFTQPDTSAVPLATAGGVFRHSQRVRETFCVAVCRLDPRLEANPRIVDPVTGALQMARGIRHSNLG